MSETVPTRRRFLRAALSLGGLAAVALAAAAAFPGPRKRLVWLAERARELPFSSERRLARHFDYLKIEPECLSQFVADWTEHVGPLSRFSALPSGIHTRFLLSTDFFVNGADESKLVRYRAFADPYVTACFNPLATFDA